MRFYAVAPFYSAILSWLYLFKGDGLLIYGRRGGWFDYCY